MSLLHQQIAPPSSWDVFEQLCHALYRSVWGDSNAQRNGRQGQPQAGVDVFGTNHAQASGAPGHGAGGLWGVQCKQKGLGQKVTQSEFDAELAKAERFEPKLAHWILAATGENDAHLQQYVRKVSAARQAQGLFPVSICFWDGICSLLVAHPEVAKAFYPAQFTPIPITTPTHSSKFYLPGISLTEHFNDPRQLLVQLRTQLLASGSSAVLGGAKAALHGMGGVGKTQLALQYCHRFKHEYSGVWWLQAQTMATLAQDCALFCSKQGLQLAPGEAPWPVMNGWLAEQRNWLLVYDNAEDAQALQAVLPATTTTSSSGHHVLITSRLPLWQGMATMELDVWQDEEALPFLQLRLPQAEQADLLALNQALGGLPLALEQACAYLANTGISIASYLQRLQEPLRAWELLDKNTSQYCSRSVLATLTLAVDKLSPAAQDLLGICAWLAPEPIPEYLFTEETEDEPDKLPASLREIARDEIAWRDTVAELHHYALCQSGSTISSDHVGNGKQRIRSLQLHRLSQAAMRTRQAESGATALVLVRAVFPYYSDQPEHWPRCRTLQAHVLHLQAMYQPGWQQAWRLDWLLAQLATYLKYGPALYQQALALERASFAICQKEFGEEDPGTLSTMQNLAASLWRLGDAATARSLQEQVLAIRRRLLGDEHSDTLRTMNNLAASLWKLGDAAAARRLEEQVLAINRRLLGEEHPDTLSTLESLATSLLKLGDAAAARRLGEQVLAIRRRVLGEEHPDTLTTMNNLALSLAHIADFPAAQTLMQQALQGLIRVLGEEHPYTLQSKHSLAVIIAAQARGQG